MSTLETHISLAITIDKGYYQHAAVMLCSLFENNPKVKFDVYLFTGVPVQAECKKLQRFCRGYGHSLEVMTIPVDAIAGLVTSAHATSAVYYRLLIPALLRHKTDVFLYLDSDLLVLGDIKTIWETNIEAYPLAAIEDPFYDTNNYLDLPTGTTYFNSGVMIISISNWEKHQLTDRAISFIERNPEKIQFWDQDALNAVLLGFWKKLPSVWNVTTTVYENKRTDKAFKPAIIHFTGSHKPWHSHCRHLEKEKYFYYLRKTPWKRFRLPEQTRWHQMKQKTKLIVNKLVGKNLFNLYE